MYDIFNIAQQARHIFLIISNVLCCLMSLGFIMYYYLEFPNGYIKKMCLWSINFLCLFTVFFYKDNDIVIFCCYFLTILNTIFIYKYYIFKKNFVRFFVNIPYDDYNKLVEKSKSYGSINNYLSHMINNDVKN